MHPLNFRDVGEALSLWIDPSPVPPRRLFRGGRFDTLSSLEDLGNPRTILNLRRGPDPTHLGVAMLHQPAPDDIENYHTSLRRVSEWVHRVLEALVSPGTEWPVYIHCTSGRDRTGVVVAAALLAAGVPHDVIVDEYLLSDGSERALIVGALEGLAASRFVQGPVREAIRRRLTEAG